jgi:hypothetical protein
MTLVTASIVTTDPLGRSTAQGTLAPHAHVRPLAMTECVRLCVCKGRRSVVPVSQHGAGDWAHPALPGQQDVLQWPGMAVHVSIAARS